MRNHTLWKRLIAVCCTLAILLSCSLVPVSAESAETGNRVTATTNASVKQGNSAYGYVYIDSLENLSTLEVTIHFDPAVVRVTKAYNQVNARLYDSSVTDSTLQYTYIFDGNGAKTKTQLFYFQYTVLSTAHTGSTYFDVVVGDAYDASYTILPISGSRCHFNVAQTTANLTCKVSGTSAVNTSVNQEFTITYQFSTSSIASGAAVIRYDPELFAVEEVVQGNFLNNKLTDINTSLSGAVYVSFLGTSYGTGTQFLTVRFKTLKNVSQTDKIALTTTDLYDRELNSIICNGYSTTVNIAHDATYDDMAPSVYLQSNYDKQAQKLTVRVCLEKNSHLGAGDFALQFDTKRFSYVSSEKGYAPAFFSINDKKTDEGLLKFSVISLTDQTAAVTMLTATFDVVAPCENTQSQLTISGSGLANHLTKPITLNFVGCEAVTADHTAVTLPSVTPTCLNTGLTDGSRCSVCQKVLLAQQIVPALGHDPIVHEAKAPTCTAIGWNAYKTCSRCNYTTYSEIPANGHSFQHGVCIVCAATQEALKSWDISASADGSLIALLYQNYDSTYELQITGSGPMKNWGSNSAPWTSYQSKIISICLSEGVTTVGNNAFYRCAGLTEITLPESIQTIGSNAFYGCTGLMEITLPERLQTIGNYAFHSCTGLTQIHFNAVQLSDLNSSNYVFSYCGTAGEGITVTVGSNVIQIPAYLFCPYGYGSDYTPKIKAVEFTQGSSCQSIGNYAFYSCADITDWTLPESIQTIGSNAFYGCTGLTEITLPERLQTIGNHAFRSCTGLTQIHFNAVQLSDLNSSNHVFSYCGTAGEGITVTIGSNVTRIPAYLLCPSGGASYAPKITEIRFEAESVCKTVGKYAFAYNTYLSHIQLPEGIEKIDTYTFYYSSISSIVLPDSVTTIGSYAFAYCKNLENVHMPNALTTIEERAFYYCSALTKIVIPENVNTISSFAFYNTKLKVVYIDSAQIAANASGSSVYGFLLQNATSVIVRSDIAQVKAYITRNYPNTETITYQGVDYISHSAHAHTWTLHEALIPNIACEQDGYDRYICSDCGALKDMITSCHNLVVNAAKAPTCVDVGWYEHQACSNCDYTTCVEIPATGHDLQYYAAQMPTCLEIGWDAYETCSRCDHTTYVELPALGHAERIDAAVAPGCTETGLTEGKYCTTCGEVLVAQTVIPANGHTYEAVVTAPTCETGGHTTYTCATCGDMFVTDYTDPSGHSYEKGVCTVCGDLLEHDHTWETGNCKFCDIHITEVADLNGDGKITAFDAQILAEAIAGRRTLPDEVWDALGTLSCADIVDYILGKYGTTDSMSDNIISNKK